MSNVPQQITDLIDSLIKAYPTGLPEGIHMNINLNVVTESSPMAAPLPGIVTPVEPINIVEIETPAPTIVGNEPENPTYKGQFIGLYRVVPRLESGRIKIRNSPALKAPEAVIRLTDKQYTFIRRLNAGRPNYLESNGYIYKLENGMQDLAYKQYGFDKQLLVISEIKRFENGAMGRVVGIGTDPYISDPKPLDAGLTNHKTTPWLVHRIESVDVFAPILTSDSNPGWVDMADVEKVR